jgi:glycogen synthase
MRPLRVLVVARWYPAVDDPVRGSFVADQVEALTATGRVEPTVVSFELARLNRVPERREPERAAIHARYADAVRERPDVLGAGGWPATVGTWPSLRSVGVARLPVASGPDDPPIRQGDDHRAAFQPFLDGYVGRSRGDDRVPAFDLVHAHTCYPDGDLAAAAASALGVPYVITEHASRTRDHLGDPAVRDRYLRAMAGAARVIVVSGALAAEIGGALPELADRLSERMEVVPNAVPVDLFRPAPRTQRRVGELLYVGARTRDKGIDTLLDAFARARARVPGLTLRMIGGAPVADEEAAWNSRAVELGIADAVSFEGAVDRAGVAAAMARADLFVHPSRYETFGVVAVEALASGLPVVATRSGGVEEILGPDPGAVGALADVDDAAGLAGAIVDVWRRRDAFDPDRLWQVAERRFAAPAVAQRLIEIYADALGEAGTLPAAESATGDASLPHREPPTVEPHCLVIVGLNRVLVGRMLGALPARLLAEITLVTGEHAPDQPLPAGIGRVVEVHLDAGYEAALAEASPGRPSGSFLARASRFVRDPGASDRIAEIHSRRAEYRLQTARAQVEAASREAGDRAAGCDSGRAPATLPDLVCLDGYDVMASEAAIDGRIASLAPGGIRWLADRWASERGLW